VTTRQEVENAVRNWSKIPRCDLPEWLRNPNQKNELDLAMAVLLFSEHPEVTPIYNDHDRLIGWKGIRLRDQGGQHDRM
jgi:hypothetical protein